MKNMVFSLGLIALATACGKVSSDPDAPPITPDVPVTACPAGATAVCSGDDLLTCDAGMVTNTTACSLGCNTAETRCNKVEPSNGLSQFLDEAEQAPDLVFVGNATIDTDAGTITDQSGPRTPPTSTLTTGLPVGIFVIKAKLVTMQSVQVVGARALAIVSAGTISVTGQLSASARLDVNGPGSLVNDFACRGATGQTNANGNSGGGGGGFGTAGGTGGRGGVPAVLGGAGGAPGGTVELVPLRGGCSGGHPGGRSQDVDPVLSDPGGGGGAIQLVSSTAIAVADGAFIAANGAGGKGNSNTLFCIVDTPCGDGEGGGSGGGILLEAPIVTVAPTGGVVANGGGGSCAVSGSALAGQLSAVPAPGQTCAGDTGSGGDGAAGGIPSRNGANGLNDDPVGGGGGGGAGRIRVNMPPGRTFAPEGVVSPTSTIGVLGTR